MNINNHFAHEWWQKEQEKKEIMIKNQDIERLNNYLQTILKGIHGVLTNGKYERYLKDKNLVNSSLIDLKYRNNFENIKIASLQIRLLREVLKNEDDDVINKEYLRNELSRAEGMLRDIDFNEYTRLNSMY